MTISLVAVFIPVLFLGGIVGRLLHEFSVTIVVAILISGFVSLSLTPMLGSRFLQIGAREAHHGRLYHLLEGGFNRLARWYERTLRIAMRFRLATLAVAILMLVGTVYLFVTMPTGFIPSQDSGFMFAVVMGPQDISFDSMAQHVHAVGADRPRQSGNRGRGRVRAGAELNQGVRLRQHEAARRSARIRWTRSSSSCGPQIMAVPGVFTFMQNPPPITVSGQQGDANAYQLTLQSTNLDEIYTWAPQADGADAAAAGLRGRARPTCRSRARR